MSTKIAIIGAGGMAAYHANGFRQAGAEISAGFSVSQNMPRSHTHPPKQEPPVRPGAQEPWREHARRGIVMSAQADLAPPKRREELAADYQERTTRR